MSNAQYTNRTCPSLGLMDDSDTSLAFPSAWNCCYHSHPIASPNLKHQAEYCLAENHCQCVVFLNQQAATSLPNHLRASRIRANRPRRGPVRTFAFIFIGIVVLVGLSWGFLTPGLILPKATSTPSAKLFPTASETPFPTVTASRMPIETHTATASSLPMSVTVTFTSTRTATPTRTPTLTFTPSNTPTRTKTPTPTSTFPPTKTATSTPSSTPTKTSTPSPTAIPPYSLEVPIGGVQKFVIHRVVAGESLSMIAENFGSTAEIITALNYSLPFPIKTDTLVIVPYQNNNTADMPILEPYQVVHAQATVEQLAALLNVDLAMLKFYNNSTVGQVFVKDNWILVPRTSKATPIP